MIYFRALSNADCVVIFSQSDSSSLMMSLFVDRSVHLGKSASTMVDLFHCFVALAITKKIESVSEVEGNGNTTNDRYNLLHSRQSMSTGKVVYFLGNHFDDCWLIKVHVDLLDNFCNILWC